MPGMTCIYRFDARDDADVFHLDTSAHASYPIEVQDDPRMVIVFEGRVTRLDPAAALARIAAIVPHQVAAPSELLEPLRRMVREWDGEFVVAVHHKPARTLGIVTDSAGRLPLYLHRSASLVIVSREVHFTLPHLERREPDRMGLA